MKIQIWSAAALLAALQNTGTSAWAPAITTLATRKVSSRSITSHYVARDVEKQKGADEDSTSAAFLEIKTKILGEPIPFSELTIGVIKETFK